MKVAYFIPTLNQEKWVIEKHLPSINLERIDSIFLHFNQIFRDKLILPKLNCPIYVSQSEVNLGVSRAWNYFCNHAKENNFDTVVIANDDIILRERTVLDLLELLDKNADGIACYTGQNAFSFFAMPLSVYDKVGQFDENFYPAYYEDNDYAMRMKILGVPFYYADGDGYFHQGSSTIKSYTAEQMEEHHRSFRRNHQYYVNKWGGSPGYETKTTI